MSAPGIDRVNAPERAGCVIPWLGTGDRPSAERHAETAGLIEALGCELAFLHNPQLRRPSPSDLLSGGLIDELKASLQDNQCTLCIVDGSLTPVQQRNLERALEVKVLDRTGLILEIFGLRARTREGQLQVELARLTYERSRLVRTWTHLERQRGGRGFLSGPGETQLEADRRMIDRAVRRLKADLDDVRRTRGLQRAGRQRAGTPMIALVGYTNAGKSTLFNRLSGADVMARDMPFATLDPTIRQIQLPSIGAAALVDTVGFITDLPTHLIDAFQATLEEVTTADLLVHVRDRASEADEDQARDVESVLKRLEKETETQLPPQIEVWNKADAMDSDRRSSLALAARQAEPPAVLLSATTGEGVDALLTLIEAQLLRTSTRLSVLLAPEAGAARAWLHAHGEVETETAGDNATVTLTVRLTETDRGRFQAKFPEIPMIDAHESDAEAAQL